VGLAFVPQTLIAHLHLLSWLHNPACQRETSNLIVCLQVLPKAIRNLALSSSKPGNSCCLTEQDCGWPQAALANTMMSAVSTVVFGIT
jgi:hypothetical protein